MLAFEQMKEPIQRNNVNTLLGTVDKAEEVTRGGGVLALSSPAYTDDVALRVKGVTP